MTPDFPKAILANHDGDYHAAYEDDNRLDSSSVACHDDTHRVWNLWEIMNTFRLGELCELLHQLEEAEESFRWHTHHHQSTDPSDDDKVNEIRRMVDAAYDLAYPLRFPTLSRKAEDSLAWLEENRPNSSMLETELRNLREAIMADVYTHVYLYVRKERTTCVDNPAFMGEEVLLAFPSAANDLKEAGNCLAAECNTAAVFHLMRVVEWGLRALCSSVGLPRLRKTTKGGKKKYAQVSYSQWEEILNQLHLKIDARLSRMRRGLEKQRDQEFYYPILHDIQGIRDAWRNHVMHTRSEYNYEDATAILVHVQRIMRKLSTRVTEV